MSCVTWIMLFEFFVSFLSTVCCCFFIFIFLFLFLIIMSMNNLLFLFQALNGCYYMSAIVQWTHDRNPFVPNVPFLYPLKASENCKVFWCFQGVEKGALGTNTLKSDSHFADYFHQVKLLPSLVRKNSNICLDILKRK